MKKSAESNTTTSPHPSPEFTYASKSHTLPQTHNVSVFLESNEHNTTSIFTSNRLISIKVKGAGSSARVQTATTHLTELVQVFMACLRSLNRKNKKNKKKPNPKGIIY